MENFSGKQGNYCVIVQKYINGCDHNNGSNAVIIKLKLGRKHKISLEGAQNAPVIYFYNARNVS